MTEALLIALAGVLDRIRGGYPSSALWPDKPAWVDAAREAAKYAYGMTLAAIVVDVWWLIPAVGVTWKLGEQLSSPWGSWSDQFRVYRGEPGGWGPAVRVGAFWPALTLPLAYFEPRLLWLLPASIIACPAAIFVSLHIPARLPPATLELVSRPAWGELLRGLGIAALLAFFGRWAA